MTTRLPLFPLNSVVFPGVATPLHVFEERYRALVRDLLGRSDPADRIFGITAIREGFEVAGPGDSVEHGRQSLCTTGTVVQLTGVEPYDDGRFDIETVGRQRFVLHEVDGSGDYAVGAVDLVTEPDTDDVTGVEAERTLAIFERYRDRLGRMRGGPVLSGQLPRDPTYLSWSLSATCLLTQAQRQELLEAPDTLTRLVLLRHSLVEEMEAMQVVPSLPATGISRMGWSPN
ncbi:peptidase S16 [Nocardioides mangrovicus]|uniref:Peptidase S16 n=1 Tax=Nocardioides mangrovicus TaxID=2478913 RepID=A0A3L8P1R9_9ACTN|nr:LON peptidase substrate-binding domain-containing protein [Nocardioides mangrovicus]RLV48981.1 peptidase S16 [Nocardioides mangrovicus]